MSKARHHRAAALAERLHTLGGAAVVACCLGGAAALLVGSAHAQQRVGGPQGAQAQAPAPAPAPPQGAGAATAAIPQTPHNTQAPLGSAMPSPMRPGVRDAGMPSPRLDLVNETLEAEAPLTREELLRLRRELLERSRGLQDNADGRAPARPTSQILQIDLSPAADVAPPVVRLSPGQGSVVSFLDAAGRPWPIAVADNANSEEVTINRFSAHQISVFTRSHIAKGNVLVGLEGLPTPVTFTVLAGQRETDYQVRLVLPRFHGDVPSNLVSQGSVPALGTEDLFNYLLMTPPANAVPLQVQGLAGARAWRTGPSTMVVRTDAQIAVANRHFSLDGVGVYEMQLSPLVVATLNGSFVQMRISGF